MVVMVVDGPSHEQAKRPVSAALTGPYGHPFGELRRQYAGDLRVGVLGPALRGRLTRHSSSDE
ncbi:hypothetical protein DXZ75_09465 [Streptomyces sp. AcE210]|nr:hypothetical protein DXZ75_09465 [Streptomyces sp. AcE210]